MSNKIKAYETAGQRLISMIEHDWERIGPDFYRTPHLREQAYEIAASLSAGLEFVQYEMCDRGVYVAMIALCTQRGKLETTGAHPDTIRNELASLRADLHWAKVKLSAARNALIEAVDRAVRDVPAVLQ